MSDIPAQNTSPPSPLRQIDRVADRFEQQWRDGDRPLIAAFVDEVPADLRLSLLAELVGIDLEHRLRNRHSVTLDDYLRELPELASLPPADRAELETHARQCAIDLARTGEYVPAAEAAPECPPAIGRYRISGHLDSGGQADVYLSFHPELLVPVVVKLRRTQPPPDAGRQDQLVREGRTLASLQPHPNLVRVYDLGFHEGRPFVVLEYVPGLTLEQQARGERLPPQQVAELVAGLARGAHAAHEQGAIHQDINPRNVVIDGLGAPRLIDFGLAWVRPTWAEPDAARPDGGTLHYLAPEQADPHLGPVSRRTDVFGLGAVLYYLLTGQPLYDGTDPLAVLKAAAHAAYDATTLERADIPKRLAAVCRKALAHDPQARYATAAELAEALTAAVRRPRRRGAAVLAGLFLVALAAGWLLGQSRRQAPVPVLSSGQASLEVRVWDGTKYVRLAEALPVRTGDQLQVRFRAPTGLHLCLFSINGQGRLSLLQHYPPPEDPTELAYPSPTQTRSLNPPEGTEGIVVCGRVGTPVSEAELQAAWNSSAGWPALDSPRRLLRLVPGQILEEGERPRDWGDLHEHPEADAVVRRLDGLRERLRKTCPLVEGLAFSHVVSSDSTK